MSTIFGLLAYYIVYTIIILKRFTFISKYFSIHNTFRTHNLTSQMHAHRLTRAHIHTQAHTALPIAATLGDSLPSSGSSWDLPLLILNLPPVKCFFLSQNWSSKYFMKQLDRSLRVVLACPKASKMHMTCSKRDTLIELLIFFHGIRA